MPQSKVCVVCKAVFCPRDRKSSYGQRWARRRVCGKRCAARLASMDAVEANERPLVKRFWEKVNKSGGKAACWPWTAAKDSFGYGRVWSGGRVDGSNRVVWELVNGPIPSGVGYHGTVVMHTCDNPSCCNPRHLRLGTNELNLQDMTRKGRHGMAKLVAEEVIVIRKKYASGKYTQEALAERYGVTKGLINMIINRKIWTHI